MQVEVEVIAFHAFIYSVPFYRNSPPMEIIAPRDSCYYVLILSPTLPHSSSWYMLRSAMCCHIRVFVTSWTVACKLPLSVGFSRQEHWSGLPFPSPMQESEKWKGSRSVMSDSSWPHGLQPTRLCCPWDFPGKSTGVGCHCLLRRIGYPLHILELPLWLSW